ncbi:MAG: transcriptional repressor LexA [Clostridiales bacterium]|jgi:repressor LexA|nr:transcriptional repressor LexA [Clostridiales bacterium]
MDENVKKKFARAGRVQDKLIELYEFIKQYQQENGYPPSVREMCKTLDISSTATAFYYLNKLSDMDLIRKVDNQSRGIEVIDKYKKNTVRIPLIGQVAAGIPIFAEQNVEDVYSMPVDLFQSGELFMLNVRGDSMINAGILDGDKIVVRCQKTCDNGEIAVALIEDEATVKRFYKEDGHIRLQPENDNMNPIIVDDAQVVGIVVGLVRSY